MMFFNRSPNNFT